ncbi:hypothetical protein Tco_0162653 [Tanacetum coccineum]
MVTMAVGVDARRDGDDCDGVVVTKREREMLVRVCNGGDGDDDGSSAAGCMSATAVMAAVLEMVRAKSLKKVMANKGKKSSMETFAPNDKADYYFGITSITVNGKNAYELKGKFLDDLHNNAFSGTNGKGAVEHIEYYLKIIDPIKLPNVDHDKLRVVVFPISLAGDLEWYEALEDSELKNEALRNKAIMEGLISDDESSNDSWKTWKSHKIYYHNYDEWEYENETYEKGHNDVVQIQSCR